MIKYTEHLELRLKSRKIPHDYPKKIYENPEQIFFDKIEKNFVAIKKMQYNGKIRNIMIAYEKKGNEICIITIHPITNEKIINRIANKRWIKNERI